MVRSLHTTARSSLLFFSSFSEFLFLLALSLLVGGDEEQLRFFNSLVLLQKKNCTTLKCELFPSCATIFRHPCPPANAGFIHTLAEVFVLQSRNGAAFSFMFLVLQFVLHSLLSSWNPSFHFFFLFFFKKKKTYRLHFILYPNPLIVAGLAFVAPLPTSWQRKKCRIPEVHSPKMVLS